MTENLVRSVSVTVLLAIGAVACSPSGSDVSTAAAPPEADQAASEDVEPEAPEEPAATDATEDAPVQTIALEQIPGDPREDNPSALSDMRDAAFPDPLIDIDRVLSGGPPPDGIPPIDDPRFLNASDVDFLEDTEPVLVLEIDGEARAYPIQIMTWHEIVNDTFGEVPVAVSYCPLCNSAVAYDRRVGDRILDFGTSGRLFNSSLVMYDRQTETLWTHFEGQAVIGSLTGTTLDFIPMTTTSWADFRDANADDSLVLSRDTGFDREYGRNPYPGYDDVNSNPFLFDGDADPRLPAQTRVVAVRGETDAAVIEQEFLFDERVVSLTVDGRELVALLLPGAVSGLEGNSVAGGRDIGSTGVFVAEVDGQALTFTPTDDGFTDDQTGSTWNIFGEALEGELSGTRLERVEHLDTFWFAFAAFRPDAQIIR